MQRELAGRVDDGGAADQRTGRTGVLADRHTKRGAEGFEFFTRWRAVRIALDQLAKLVVAELVADPVLRRRLVLALLGVILGRKLAFLLLNGTGANSGSGIDQVLGAGSQGLYRHVAVAGGDAPVDNGIRGGLGQGRHHANGDRS